MNNMFNKFTVLSAISLAILSGCGGGGGSSASPSTPTTPTTPAPPSSAPLDERITMVSPTQVETQQSVGLVAMVSSGAEIITSEWEQTAGPATTFLAENSQVIGFDVQEAGSYAFTYRATDSQGSTTEQEVTFTAQQSSASTVAQLRLDHAVTERGKVSLRIDASDPGMGFTVTWRQLSGPTIPTDDLTPQGNFLFFDAPSVTKDELIEFEAAVTFNDGSNGSDSAFVLVKNTDINNGGFFPDAASRIVTEDARAYNSTGQYANVLVDCVYNNQIDASCRFSTLPIIGQDTPNPTIDDIMSRVVVSHDWMAERFREYLQTSPVAPDIIQLLKAVTAIVISVDVRPSFYWAATGAIYLDPDNFWVTPEERDTLNDVPDFRSGFGNDLQFIMPWRYVRNGQNYLNATSYHPKDRLTRTTADVQADITWLLFHELAHANDFIFPSAHATLAPESSPLQFVNDNTIPSDLLDQRYPLASQEMKSLAQVSFAGNTASSVQKGYVGINIEQFFEPDAAAMYYSYLTDREDFATIFERFMMAYRLGVHSDVAIIETNENPNNLVHWGQRNRVVDPKLRNRTIFVVNSIYSNLDVASALNDLPAQQNMVPGVSWFDNLMASQSPIPALQFKGPSSVNTIPELRLGPHDHQRGRPILPKIK